MTKLYLPRNIFSKIFASEIQSKIDISIEFLPSSLIAKHIIEDQNSIGLIPTLDLLTNKDLFVSSKIGISFDALLSNAYIHFKEEQKTIEEIFLKGEVSSNEVILSKILFKEFYGVTVKITLLSQEPPDFDENILIVGDENFEREKFFNGLSFAEEIIEMINAPYVNFVLAGASDEIVKNFNSDCTDVFKKAHNENISQLFPEFPQTSLDFISVNIQHVIFDFDEQDLEAIKLLLQMPYFHGLLKEMIEVKFV
jgi:hypothetical protein